MNQPKPFYFTGVCRSYSKIPARRRPRDAGDGGVEHCTEKLPPELGSEDALSQSSGGVADAVAILRRSGSRGTPRSPPRRVAGEDAVLSGAWQDRESVPTRRAAFTYPARKGGFAAVGAM